jgi:hypothetical protein
VRVCIGLIAALLLAPPAWTYINGGDFHTTHRDGEKKLKSEGWSVGSAVPEVGTRGPLFVPADGPDGPDYQQWVNQFVGRAVKDLPAKEADAVTAEVKREIARVAREAIGRAVSGKKAVLEKGEAGSLRYQVGAYEYESYWETNYGGKREIHAKRSGVVPFVAVKVAGAADRPR